jgi:hypothetical protein
LFRRETQQGYQRIWRQGSELASEARAEIVQLAPAFIGAQGRLVPAEIYRCSAQHTTVILLAGEEVRLMMIGTVSTLD